MIQTESINGDSLGEYFFIENEILWSIKKDNWDVELQNINGKEMFPHRKILTVESLENEFKENGFMIVDKKILQDDKTPTYIAWLKKI